MRKKLIYTALAFTMLSASNHAFEPDHSPADTGNNNLYRCTQRYVGAIYQHENGS